jgi:hypothetical protein
MGCEESRRLRELVDRSAVIESNALAVCIAKASRARSIIHTPWRHTRGWHKNGIGRELAADTWFSCEPTLGLKECQVKGEGRNGAFVLASVWLYQICYLTNYGRGKPLACIKDHLDRARWRIPSG